MKSKIYIFFSMACLSILGLTLMSNWNGVKSAAAGSPIEGGSNCTQCHSGTVNSGGGSIDITGLDSYSPGEEHTITVQVNDETSSKFGYQAIVVDKDDNAVGTLVATDGSAVISSGGNNYVGHNAPAADGTFQFKWTAPASDVGAVKVYVAGNATNGNSQTSGDKVYTTSLEASANANNIASATTNEINVYPNPSTGSVKIETGNAQTLKIFTLSGSLVKNFTITNQKVIELNDLETGMYLVVANQQNGIATSKIVVQ